MCSLLLLSRFSFSVKLAIPLLTYLICALSFFSNAQAVQLNYKGTNTSIASAVEEANRILNSPDFHNRVRAILQFDNTKYSGSQIADDVKNLHRRVEIREYWNPFGIANAKTVSIIKINTAKLNRNHASITNTIVHETIHAVDWWTNSDWDYTHDGNSPDGQDNTAPWVIGKIAEDLVLP